MPHNIQQNCWNVNFQQFCNYRESIFTKETGTANQGNLGSEDIKKIVYIPLPPLAEQKHIVAKIEQLLPLCDRLKFNSN
ncbi:restriction endonuclease subunit S [Oribacterium sp. HCP3S3_B9]|uniref:restriction endonuclease subunit S n=1 Tax=Oribacterium sp. HCP3S3_B9 TaxID=3438946 RepID=UPI003F8A5869